MNAQALTSGVLGLPQQYQGPRPSLVLAFLTTIGIQKNSAPALSSSRPPFPVPSSLLPRSCYHATR
jgi:hypothetical protein